jgi:hypothetical protein
MDPNSAELTTVLEHDASGRILRFVKTVVTAAAAESLKAKALLAAEEKKAAAILQDTDGWLAKAKSPGELATSTPAPAARPVPQQRAMAPVASRLQSEQNVQNVSRGGPVTLKANAEAKRRATQAQLEAKRIQATIAETKALMAEAKALISARATKAGTYAGAQTGRDVAKAVPITSSRAGGLMGNRQRRF